MYNPIRYILEWLLPYTCVFCGAPGHEKLDLCKDCSKELPWLEHACPRCAQPYSAYQTDVQLCGTCLKDPPPYDNTIATFIYQKPVDYLIGGLKFHSQLVYARLLSELLLQSLNQHYQPSNRPQMIIPMPLHKTRLRERGFNQAVELARPIAKLWGIPISLHDCQRIRATPAQLELPAKQRRKNVKNAFQVQKNFHFEHVAILDDVITTGSTVQELSLQLRRQGVKKIDVWCCAKTGAIT
ncbi:MAG: double zinc ribbon domain-containing protein [Gammaproteobacteria bacterium]